MTNDTTLVVNQVYGPVHQGEGPSTGRICSFIRLMGCNLSCDWVGVGGQMCDEAQTWNSELYDLRMMGKRVEAEEVAAKAVEMGHGMVVITGGEPLLWQSKPGWSVLLPALHKRNVRIEVETNGTIMPGPYSALVDQWNVSPKLRCSGQALEKRLIPDVLKHYVNHGRAVFKFVVAGEEDVAEVAILQARFRIPDKRLWVMPEGVSSAVILERARELAPLVLEQGWNLTLRQQVLVYGSEGEPRD